MAGSYPGEYKTQRATLSEFEADKQARRVALAIRRGANKTTLLKMGLTEKRIREIIEQHGITEIPKGVGGKRL